MTRIVRQRSKACPGSKDLTALLNVDMIAKIGRLTVKWDRGLPGDEVAGPSRLVRGSNGTLSGACWRRHRCKALC